MSIGLIFALVGIGSVASLILGHKWGLRIGERRAQAALKAQKEEFLRQQQRLEKIDEAREKQVEKIQAAQTPEEAAGVLAQLNHSWNTGH